jgi:hypothetical protein
MRVEEGLAKVTAMVLVQWPPVLADIGVLSFKFAPVDG